MSLLLYIYCNFGCKHGKTLLKVCKEELNLFETNKHMLNNSKHVFVVGLIINSYTIIIILTKRFCYQESPM